MTIAQHIAYYLYMALMKPLSWLPLPMLYAISNALYYLMRYVIRYRLHIVRKNLRTCFPEFSQEQLNQAETDFYRQLCDNIVETIKLLHTDYLTLSKRITVTGQDAVRTPWQNGKPIVLFLGHYANWEWVPYISFEFMPDLPCRHIYKPPHDVAFDKVMLKMRRFFPSMPITQRSALRTMLSLKRDSGPFMIGIIADHRPNGKKGVAHTTFLGQDTAFATGAEDIGHRIDADYVYLDVKRISRGRYTYNYTPIIPSQEQLAQGPQSYPYTKRYLEMMEQTIRRQPGLWLWSHRRWLD